MRSTSITADDASWLDLFRGANALRVLVLAAGVATINRLAPGRVFVAMGTGNTGMRVLGRKPMTLKSFEAYARTVKGLLEGKEVPKPEHVTHDVLLSNGVTLIEYVVNTARLSAPRNTYSISITPF